MNNNDTYPHPSVATGRALRHKIAARLMADVLQGRTPAGTRLVVMKLAQRFGVSSTPAREALVELESVGLIQFVHNRGAVVKPFGPQQLRQIYHLRRILETEAARCACGSIDRIALETLHAELLDLDREMGGDDWPQRAMDSDRQLHELVAVSCGSARLADEIRRYNTLVQTGREIVGNRRRAQDRALDEHIEIVDRLLACDAQGAAEGMARHIDTTSRLVEAVMFYEDAPAPATGALHPR